MIILSILEKYPYKKGVYIRGKKVKIYLGITDKQESAIFAGDKTKIRSPINRFLPARYVYRVMTADSSFLRDELKPYKYMGPLNNNGKIVDIVAFHKHLTKTLRLHGEEDAINEAANNLAMQSFYIEEEATDQDQPHSCLL